MNAAVRRHSRCIGAFLFFAISGICVAATDTSTEFATVFFTRFPASVQDGIIREGMVRRMVDSLVIAASGKADVVSAWREFVNPKDRIGIKVSTTGAPVSFSHPAIVEAVAEGLVSAGVPPANIVIWDRTQRGLDRANLDRLAPRFRVIGTDRAGGYASDSTITAPVMGRLIAGDHDFTTGREEKTSSRSHLSSVLANRVDKIIHIPALADSVFAGVNGAFAGMTLDNLDNWRRLARAPHYGNPFLPEIYADPRFGGRVVLTILDALRPQYSGGPFPGAGFNVNYGAIFASRDPVAIDATGRRLLDNFRREAGFPPLEKYTHWLDSAELMGMGFAAWEKIKMIRAGSSGEVRWLQP